MRIDAIDLWRIQSPLVRPYPLSKVYGTLTHAEAVFLRLTTSDGLEGWGEADPLPPFTEEWPGGAMLFLGDLVAPLLIGRDPSDLAAILNDLDGLAPGNSTAKGAVDMALHDLLGKAAGVPVHTLLGGRLHDRIPVLWPLGTGTLEESLEVVSDKVSQGYRTFMIKTGSGDVARDAARTLALIERHHPDVGFIADANQGWSESEALRFVHLVAAAPLTLLEQPVSKENPAGLKRVRMASIAPVSADESVFSLKEAARLAADRAVDVFSIKPSKNGGLAASHKIAALAEGHGIGILMNSMIEFGVTQAASLQLGLTLPNLLPCGHAYMSTLRIRQDPTDFARLVAAGFAAAPEAPGLGIAVDIARVEDLAVAHRRVTGGRGSEAAA